MYGKLSRPIKVIQLGVLSGEVVRGMSVTTSKIINGQIIESGIYKENSKENGIPEYGGVLDPRLGPVEGICVECNMTSDNCPGHFGHLELAEPMYNIGFIGIVYNHYFYILDIKFCKQFVLHVED